MGEFRGKALRWDYEAIKRRENNGSTFEQALKMKSMIKMDVVTLLNGRFIEITEVYNIYIDGSSNADYTKEIVRKELNDDMLKQIKDGNYMQHRSQALHQHHLRQRREGNKARLSRDRPKLAHVASIAPCGRG